MSPSAKSQIDRGEHPGDDLVDQMSTEPEEILSKRIWAAVGQRTPGRVRLSGLSSLARILRANGMDDGLTSSILIPRRTTTPSQALWPGFRDGLLWELSDDAM